MGAAPREETAPAGGAGGGEGIEPRRLGATMQLLSLLSWAMLPGCWAMTGPKIVRGFLGRSLLVTCRYRQGLEMKPKFWCVPGNLLKTCAEDIVVTSGLQPVVHRDRFSIRDDREWREITVTVDNLTERDAGTYRCGVRKGTFQPDESHSVKVILSLASPTSATKHVSLSTSVSVYIQKTPQGTAVQPASNPSNPDISEPAHLDVVEHILTPSIIVILLLLLVAAGVLVMLSRKRKKALSGAAIEMDRTHSLSQTGVDSLNYAVINHCPGRAESQLYSSAEAFCSLGSPATEYSEVRQSDKKSLPEQQEIYANVPPAPQPSEEPYSMEQRV
ncbi:protein CD300H-like isoform X2 [Calypte anna]|uniref:protein CD300H-like isoform X2 n=1 Tax=Calypte anna TaxID=9244 RepID=UPI0011C46B68|nr:protein CD300H-like isoform X2 [Calypte anna]